MSGLNPNAAKRQTLQDALSISLGLSSSYGTRSFSLSPKPRYQSNSTTQDPGSTNIDNYLSRSFAGGAAFNRRPSTSVILDDQTEDLEGQTEFIAENDEYYNKTSSSSPSSTHSSAQDIPKIDSAEGATTENSPLLQNSPLNDEPSYRSSPLTTNCTNNLDLESQVLKKQDSLTAFQEIKDDFTPSNMLTYTPAVILGTLLNILDALSYGMIIFPISDAAFSGLANAGLSMFYISCIISQVLFSCGWSQFKAGIGSEMIEVTPFFHSMALTILHDLGGDQADHDVVISTTITTYAISSMVTGLIFFLLGYFKMGELVSYFPRHILVGCIGGVGYFLIITGIEISTGAGPFEYNMDYISKLLEFSNISKLGLAVVVTLLLLLIQLKNNGSLVLPSFYIAVLFLFHFMIIILPNLTLEDCRKAGYLFDTSAASNESWYEFYYLYRLDIVDWWLVFKQIPTILALTFFGILHVPINIPALAVSTKQENDVNVDKELLAHGMSNFISGALGSIQNYLVYTNSLLFIRAGADSRVAGLMLAFATFLVLISGSLIVSVIPVCVVGSLIFLLGYELLKEALCDTYGKTSIFEYFTIAVIVVTMGAYDFVGGVFVGVLLAFVQCVADQSRTPVIRKEFTGEIARSTVMRHPLQDFFLRKIGKQVYVLKLQSYLFFGSIGGLEKRIKNLFEIHQIRYLILDFTSVLNVDFSASEGLNRIKKVVFENGAFLIISLGDDKIHVKLDKVGLFDSHLNLKVFKELNSALEWSENEFLVKYKEYKSSNTVGSFSTLQDSNEDDEEINNNNDYLTASQIIKNHPVKDTNNLPINTPRNTNFLREASHYLKTENSVTTELFQTLEPGKKNESDFAKLFLFAIQIYTDQLTTEFWQEIIPKFERRVVRKADNLFREGEDFVVVVETGSLTVSHMINSYRHTTQETFISRTLFGKFDGASSVAKYATSLTSEEFTVTAKRDSTVWCLFGESLREIKEKTPEKFIELLMVLNKVDEKRGQLITGHTLMST